MTSQFADSLREQLAILLDVAPSSIGDDDSFEELGVDSLMRLEIIAYVEQNIGRELPDQELPEIGSIREVVNYVQLLG